MVAIDQVTVRVTVDSYNSRRYSKPWIARATAWPTGANMPTLDWGAYVGNDSGGELQLVACPGEVVRWGQRDHRNPKCTVAAYGVVAADGTIHRVDPVVAKQVMDGTQVELPPSKAPIL